MDCILIGKQKWIKDLQYAIQLFSTLNPWQIFANQGDDSLLLPSTSIHHIRQPLFLVQNLVPSNCLSINILTFVMFFLHMVMLTIVWTRPLREERHLHYQRLPPILKFELFPTKHSDHLVNCHWQFLNMNSAWKRKMLSA